MNSQRIVSVFRWTTAALALAGIVLVYHRWLHVNPTTVALTLLLFVLILAAEWSLQYAVVVSIAATFCYNYFFLPPIGTLTISDPQNWLALIAFLSTAVIGSRLSQRARNQTEEARAKQRDLEILFRLSRELLQTENVSEVIAAVPPAIVGVTRARSALLYLLDGDRLYQAGEERMTDIELPHLRQQSASLSSAQRNRDEINVPLRAGAKPRGLLVMRGLSLSQETAEAIGGLVSISMERAQALEEVAHSEATRESERLRTLMIDSMTHELRTPLTSIQGAATTLLSHDELPSPERRELLTIIDEESERIDRLVGQAVEMAQLDARKVQMHFSSVNVHDLIQSALESCGSVEDTHTLTLHLPDDLPRIQADAEMVRKVICNLFENAAKYSPAASPILVTAEAKDGIVAISVADRGVGIEAAEQSLIFDRFYRASVHSQRVPGTGMGLSISRAIVDAHGGTMAVTSQPGHGSVFTFTIPTART